MISMLKYFFSFFALMAMFLTISISSCWAAVAIEVHIASGTIKQVDANRSITLDNGTTYFASRTELMQALSEGQRITIRYVEEATKKNVFFEYAQGLNSLSNESAITPTTKKNAAK